MLTSKFVRAAGEKAISKNSIRVTIPPCPDRKRRYSANEYPPIARNKSIRLIFAHGLGQTCAFALFEKPLKDHIKCGHLYIHISNPLEVHIALPYRMTIKGAEMHFTLLIGGCWNITPTWTNSVPKYEERSRAIHTSRLIITLPIKERQFATSEKNASTLSDSYCLSFDISSNWDLSTLEKSTVLTSEFATTKSWPSLISDNIRRIAPGSIKSSSVMSQQYLPLAYSTALSKSRSTPEFSCSR